MTFEKLHQLLVLGGHVNVGGRNIPADEVLAAIDHRILEEGQKYQLEIMRLREYLR